MRILAIGVVALQAGLLAFLADPAAAQMRTSIGSPYQTMGGTTSPMALGLSAGYGTDAFPQLGLDFDIAGLGPLNLHTAPRMNLGPLQSFFIPVTLRPNELVAVPSVYFGLGPFAEFSPGSAGGGGLLELGVRTPLVSRLELEVGVEGGYRLTGALGPIANFTLGLLYRP